MMQGKYSVVPLRQVQWEEPYQRTQQCNGTMEGKKVVFRHMTMDHCIVENHPELCALLVQYGSMIRT